MRYHESIRSWQDAERYYKTHPKAHWPKVPLYYATHLSLYYATHLSVEDSPHDASRTYVLWHHGVGIITYYANGVIYVNNRGYQTNTTKDRLNAHLPLRFHIFQKNWEWYINVRASADDPTYPGATIRYRNGYVDSWLVIVSQ